MTNDPNHHADHDIDPLEVPGPEEVAYPLVLRLTAAPHDEHHEETLDCVERWEDGEAVPHVKNFSDPSRLRKVLTTQRVELIRSIRGTPPESMTQLADHLERGTKQVHDDVHLLEEFGIVYLEDGKGRARKPTIPYDRIEIDVGIEAPPLMRPTVLSRQAEKHDRRPRRPHWDRLFRPPQAGAARHNAEQGIP